MKVPIVGIGHTKFGELKEDIGMLMANVAREALDDAKMDINEVDAVYIANFSSSFTEQCFLPAVLASKMNIKKRIIRVESACAAGGAALWQAFLSISSGLYNVVLVIGVEKMTSAATSEATKILSRAASDEERRHGVTFPGLYALIARRHFYEYGTTEEHLAMIAVKNHKNAMNNPLAHLHKIITIEDVLKSRIIASPLKLLDCSPVSDGASAVILCRDSISIKYTDTPVYIIGMGSSTDSIELFNRSSLTSMPSVIEASKEAYRMARVSPNEINVAEVHDCFTIAELVQMEDLGFCKKGEGKMLVKEGVTEIDGKIPINPSGGLKAKGHPIGATGVSQVVEVVKQLRHEASKRQVPNAEVGLCCNIGGSGAAAFVTILKR